jgi:hypothetical protein
MIEDKRIVIYLRGAHDLELLKVIKHSTTHRIVSSVIKQVWHPVSRQMGLEIQAQIDEQASIDGYAKGENDDQE